MIDLCSATPAPRASWTRLASGLVLLGISGAIAACSSSSSPKQSNNGEFLSAAVAVVRGRVMSEVGLALDSVRVRVVTDDGGANAYSQGIDVSDAQGRFWVDVERFAGPPSAKPAPDTTAAILLIEPIGSKYTSPTGGREGTQLPVVLRFSPKGNTPIPTEVEVRLRL